MKGFFHELKRRRVYRIALGYILAASGIVQVVGTVLPMFHAPEWMQQAFVVVMGLGFPVALMLGWAFDVRGGSLLKTASMAPRKSTDYRRLAILAGTGLLIAGLAVSAYLFWYPWMQRERADAPKGSPIPHKSIAVLPFENLSDKETSAYITEGVQDQIINDLAKVAELKVTSRTSAMQYEGEKRRNLRQIAKELGVAHVLEGTVQREGDRVRVSAQLIDAGTDTNIWGDHYDRNINDLFALESEVAEIIVTQLKAKLSPEVKAAIEEQPTTDLAAYDLYTRANTLIAASVFNVRDTDNLYQAARLLEEAVTRDPNYFLAYCRLASAHDQIYLAGADHTPARLAQADAALKAAMRLRPNAGETHLALAEHLYCGYLDFDRAREELKIAQRSLPNKAVVFELTGYIDRRQGRWDDSTRNLVRAVDLDPRNLYILQQLALSYRYLRRFPEAIALLDRILEISPNDDSLRVNRAVMELDWHADAAPLHALIENIVAANPGAASGLADQWLYLALCERDPMATERALAAIPPQGYSSEGFFFPRSWCQALTAAAAGNSAGARSFFTAARAEVEKSLQDQPDYGESLALLGMIDAALGRHDEAIREGRRAVGLLPLNQDSINGGLATGYLAVIYAWTGEMDLAIEQLKMAIAISSDVTYGQLRLHPFWDPLRTDPRFEEIVAGLAPAAGDH